MSLVSSDPATATFIAVTPCTVSRDPVENLRAHGKRQPEFTARLYQGLVRVIGDRIIRMNSDLTERKVQEGFTAVS